MSRTVTAVFDSRSEAESARERLTSSGIDTDRVRIIDQGSTGSSNGAAGAAGQHEGFWASLKDMFMPDEDRHAYGEAISRGGYLLTAEVDESDASRACDLLEQSNSVDFDQRQNEWRAGGWAGYQADGQSGAFGRLSGGDRDRDRAVDEERIPIAEEELRVGKREVERGGARVRSYVREVPVREQVNLREEHVEVERRPVSGEYRQSGANGDIFQDREIEMTERAEEAVVAKEAHVREELVVRKTAEERAETIDDTVRRTEVDVDENAGLDRAGSERSAFTGLDRDRDITPDTREAVTDYERTTGRDRDLL